ncbi:MAG: hypothetical protein AAB336_09360 [Acidobacteriota bacterium]
MKFTPIAGGQRVAANQRELEANKPLSVFWETTTATIGQTVKIRGVVKNPVGNLQPPIWVLFDGTRYQSIANAKIQGGQIIAEWRVTPFKSGTFTSGNYDVEIIYGGLVGKTSLPLRIATAGYNPNVSSFG